MRNEEWDAVIVGAGPAGGVAAAMLAGRGWRVLLLERSRWPREKVCGGCLNAAAVTMLRGVGLGGVLRGEGSGPRLDRFTLNVGARMLSLPLPEGGGLAIPRETLDARIVEEGVKRGCVFLPEMSATLLPMNVRTAYREIRVLTARATGTPEILRARIVLACDGIAGTLLENEPWAAWRIARDAWFGASTTLLNGEAFSANGTITMRISAGGYVGAVRYGDGRLHVAAAMSTEACRHAGGPARLIETIVRDCGERAPEELMTARFQGTGLLTRRRKSLGGHRVLAVGDACGYVEPFTGEGIAWAIRSAQEVVALLPQSLETWPAGLSAAWTNRHQMTVGVSQRWCHLLRKTLRHPMLAKCGVGVAALFPAVGGALANRIGRQLFSVHRHAQGVGE